MKQEYVVLRKENDWLYDYVGKQYSRSLLGKAYDRLYKEHGKFGFPGFAKSIVTVIDEHKRILAMGGSSLLKERKTGKIIPDLTMNNFGALFAAAFTKVPANNSRTATLTNTAGQTGGAFGSLTTYNAREVDNNSFGYSSQPTSPAVHGTLFQVGSGSSAPTKSDNNIETAFGTAPEDALVNGTNETYDTANSRLIADIAIVAGGAGTVNESGYFGNWFGSAGVSTFFLIFHDAISPGVPFIATNTITPSYTWQF